jgi:hypothetical protein
MDELLVPKAAHKKIEMSEHFPISIKNLRFSCETPSSSSLSACSCPIIYFNKVKKPPVTVKLFLYSYTDMSDTISILLGKHHIAIPLDVLRFL